MKKLRAVAFAAITAVGILASTVQAQAQVTWDQVKQKVTSAKDYQVTYKYDGPKGVFTFDYRTVPPDKIRIDITESKDSSKKGVKIFYDTTFSKEKVRFNTGGGVIVRNVTHKDVSEAFYKSLYHLIVDQVGSAKPQITAEGDRTKFTFSTGGGRYMIWANKNAEIVKTERTIDGKDREVREFTTIKWNVNPDMSF